MNTLTLPCPTGSVSDGYHTFDELYDHRCALFLALMKTSPGLSWISRLHEDGSAMDNWFIAGMCLPSGDITYHLPDKHWTTAMRTGARVLVHAPKWDQHNSADVVKRLLAWVENE